MENSLNKNKYTFNDITIITTVDFIYRKANLFCRLINFLKLTDSLQLKTILVINIRRCFFLNFTLYFLKKNFPLLKIIKISSKENNNVNNSYLRNLGFQKVCTKYTIISDIDLIFDQRTIQGLLDEANSNHFSIAPVLYLNKSGQKSFKKHSDILSFLSFIQSNNNRLYKHIAIPSSFMCVETEQVHKIKGFDEQYTGHGYEDFDFMIRLINSYQKKSILNEYSYIDEPYKTPILMQGFRADIAKFCIPNFFNNIIGLHLDHKKNKNYKESREKNKKIFHKKFFLNITNRQRKNIFPFFEEMLIYCNENKIILNRYHLI